MSYFEFYLKIFTFPYSYLTAKAVTSNSWIQVAQGSIFGWWFPLGFTSLALKNWECRQIFGTNLKKFRSDQIKIMQNSYFLSVLMVVSEYQQLLR